MIRHRSTLSSPYIKPLLTTTEFHAELGGAVGLSNIRRLVREGKIKSIRAGERKRLIPASEIHDWPAREIGN